MFMEDKKYGFITATSDRMTLFYPNELAVTNIMFNVKLLLVYSFICQIKIVGKWHYFCV